MIAPARRSLLQVAAAAALVIVAADLGIGRLVPVAPPLAEVDDGVAEYRAGDPDTLVLGSSHARSFLTVRDLVAERTAGRHRMAVVPVEWGTFRSYQWVYEHRLRPLLDERRRLARALVITTYFDLCSWDHVASRTNLPARAWELSDYLRDVATDGATPFNRNYVDRLVRRALPSSSLVQSRGYERIQEALYLKLKGLPPRGQDPQGRREATERSYAYCDDPLQKRAAEELLDDLQRRGVQVTLVAFPQAPEALSPLGRETTLARFDRWAADLGRRRGLRVVDLTSSTPMVARDFRADLDHPTVEGDRKLAEWVLAHELADLLEPPPAPARGRGEGGGR